MLIIFTENQTVHMSTHTQRCFENRYSGGKMFLRFYTLEDSFQLFSPFIIDLHIWLPPVFSACRIFVACRLWLWCEVLVSWKHVESQDPDQGLNQDSCIARQILNHCTTREVPQILSNQNWHKILVGYSKTACGILFLSSFQRGRYSLCKISFQTRWIC